MQNLSLVESCSNTDTSLWTSLRDLAVEVGGISLVGSDCNMNERTNNEEITNPGVMQQSLPVVNSSSRSEGFSESSYCTSEPSGSWGDFEGFRESLGKSERFDQDPEISVKSTKTSEDDTDWSRGHCSTSAGHLCSEPSLHSGIRDVSSSLNESSDHLVTSTGPVLMGLDRSPGYVHTSKPPPYHCWRRNKYVNVMKLFDIGWKKFGANASVWRHADPSFDVDLGSANHSYEDILKLGFPEVFVSQSREHIRSLDQVLDTNNEDVGIPELMKNQLCIDSGNIWRTLRDLDNTSRLRHPWSKSHCQENLLSVLGIDANRTDFSKSQDDIFEESDVKDNEDFGFGGFGINNCKALIQTKLSVSPDSRRDLFTCNLFLKTTSSNGNKQHITIPRKKHIFTTHNLKTKFFNNDIC